MSPSKDLRFLVVDDFEPMRKTVQSNLSALGFKQVILAADGSEAIALLKTHHIDCIISDWNMPKVAGIELLRHVRGEPRLEQICFMMVTAEGEREMVTSAIEAGVDQFLVKPFTQAALRDKLLGMLARGPRSHRPPLAPPPKSRQPEAAPPAAALRARRPQVLVVDDVPSNIELLAETLKQHYQVRAAIDGKTALRICQSTPRPDLVLLDIMMPAMDGYAVCRQLKLQPETAAIPVIFLSARSDTVDITQGFALGAVDYITKPANPDIVLARVATHLRLKQAQDELAERIDTLLENARLREDVERITRHDLKNPLAAIIGTSEALGGDNRLAAAHQQQAALIRDAALKMLGQINRSLDLYKMETGSYRPQPQRFNLSKLLQRVVADARVAAQARQIEIAYQAPDACYALAEELLCFSLLGNLLRNAVEASPAAARIRVSLEAGSPCVIRIHNQGAIPAVIRATLFDKYVTAGKAGGTGLGTYSARLMARAQGGEISFTSSDTQGTTFKVELPGAAAQPGAAPLPAGSTTAP